MEANLDKRSRRLILIACALLAAATGTVNAAAAGAAGDKPSLQADELKGQWALLSRLGAGSGSTQVKICDGGDCSAAGAKSSSDQRYEVEIGIRNGKLVGCQVSDAKGPNDSAVCSLARDSLQIEMGRSDNKIVHELKKNADGTLSGDTFMKSAALPGGRMKIGEVSLKRPAKS